MRCLGMTGYSLARREPPSLTQPTMTECGRARIHACQKQATPKAFPLCRRLAFLLSQSPPIPSKQPLRFHKNLAKSEPTKSRRWHVRSPAVPPKSHLLPQKCYCQNHPARVPCYCDQGNLRNKEHHAKPHNLLDSPNHRARRTKTRAILHPAMSPDPVRPPCSFSPLPQGLSRQLEIWTKLENPKTKKTSTNLLSFPQQNRVSTPKQRKTRSRREL
jgi:hypothetical protein